MSAFDVVIVGGGLGATACALAVTDLGLRAVLAAHDEWLGGQISGQAVPPDEHPWIESLGATRRYAELRYRVREYYRAARPLSDAARYDPQLNPGMGRVSRLCAEPVIWERCIEDMLAPAVGSGLLEIRRAVRPVAAHYDADTLRSVTFEHRDGRRETAEARWFVDATEWGDLIALAGVESVVGSESADETGELHAPRNADPTDQQAASWCAAVELCPGEDHRTERPDDYDRWNRLSLPGWPGPLFSWTDVAPDTLKRRFKSLMDFERNEEGRDEFSLWVYRRIRAAGVYREGAAMREATLINWVHIDYTGTPFVGVDEATRRRGLEEARRQTAAFIHWLQNDAPRRDGGVGYRELRPVGDLVGSADGLAREIYVRESRRIRALKTITEADVGVEMRSGMAPGAEQFPDSVGVGSYRIDLHPSTSGRNYVDISTWPFQIPLGALLPVSARNLVPASKNIGTTHVTNGCYRLHPIEWNIGEAAGATVAHCLRAAEPVQAAATSLVGDIQRTMETTFGVDLAWPRWARETPRLGAEMPGQRS